jgi:hypothetical protein
MVRLSTQDAARLAEFVAALRAASADLYRLGEAWRPAVEQAAAAMRRSAR